MELITRDPYLSLQRLFQHFSKMPTIQLSEKPDTVFIWVYFGSSIAPTLFFLKTKFPHLNHPSEGIYYEDMFFYRPIYKKWI